MHITIPKRGKIIAYDRVVIGFGFVSDWLIELVTRRFLNQSQSEVKTFKREIIQLY